MDNFNQTFRFIDLDGNSVPMSVAQQIEYTNDSNSHSGDFKPYDIKNWIEGMLEFGGHSVIFQKGQVFLHKGKRVVLLKDTHITEDNRYIKTNKGKLHIHHCFPIAKIIQTKTSKRHSIKGMLLGDFDLYNAFEYLDKVSYGQGIRSADDLATLNSHIKQHLEQYLNDNADTILAPFVEQC